MITKPERVRMPLGLSAVVLLSLCGSMQASQPPVELLWSQGAPGAKGEKDADKPTLTIHLPPEQKTTGCGVVICPGGGYGHLAIEKEGHEVAAWLNSFGAAGFVLKYRHRGTGYGHPAPLQDAQRAVRMVRMRAKDWGVDPSRIGILGFSAGGHLASTVGTHFQKDRRAPAPTDALSQVSCRPDFMILLYPVISFTKPVCHRGSRKNLLGSDPDQALVVSLSNELQVTPETPPTFLVHADDDTGVPPENSICFYLALRKAKVQAEMHIYQVGGHGFGLRNQRHPVSSWPIRCADWMRSRGLLDRK